MLHSTHGQISYGYTLSHEYVDHDKNHGQLHVDIVINPEKESAAGYSLNYYNPLVPQLNPPTQPKVLDQFIEKWLTELIKLEYTEITSTI
ncbi:hypothetical protein [uncultured Shewanella sp.]|uniref:hypothetical protein n=1 Tax=uncultured Shewanella sp. TaxID=173975 RepID=UPI002617C5D6|nr:hypothetical protein [uncultured Shewanella sp.]